MEFFLFRMFLSLLEYEEIRMEFHLLVSVGSAGIP